MNEYYLLHYFNLKNAGIFLLVSFLGMFAVLAVILCAAKIQAGKADSHKIGTEGRGAPGVLLLHCTDFTVYPFYL